MLDGPTPDELLAAVAAFLRDVVVADASARVAFQARIAARVVELVRRELSVGDIGERAELVRLEGLLGHTGDLAHLNAALADAIDAGGLADTPALVAHLRATAIEKLVVDQPDYSGYRVAVVDAAQHKDD